MRRSRTGHHAASRRRRRTRNRRPPLTPIWSVVKAWLFLTGVVAVFGLLGYALGGVRLSSIFVFAGLLLGLGAHWSADRAVLGMLGAREVLPAEDALLHSTVERLAARAGVPKPRLYVIETGPPLGLVVGRGAYASSLVLTESLIALPAPAEIEGVIAHELAHVANRDLVLQSPIVMLAAGIVELSRLGGWLERGLLFVLGPVAAAVIHLLLSPQREIRADRMAAEICESPHSLADALVRLDQAAELVEFAASPATEPLYTINPFEERGLAAMFITHPPVSERVRRLRDLDPDWRERLRAA
jgi:heat shock protein HtpX